MTHSKDYVFCHALKSPDEKGENHDLERKYMNKKSSVEMQKAAKSADIEPKLIMNLQLFADTGVEESETTEPIENNVDEENLFNGVRNNDVPDWLRDDVEEKEEKVEELEDEVEEVVEDEVEELEETPDEIKQSDKTNAAFAELRRQKKEFQKLKQENDEWAVRNFGDVGVKDFDSYRKMMDTQIMDNKVKELEEKGYDVKAIQDAISLDPNYAAMLAAAKFITKGAEIAEPKEVIEPKEEIKEKPIDDEKLLVEYTALEKAFPDLITKPEDISNEVWAKYEKGYELMDAFKLVNEGKIKEKITKKAKEIARQETLNKLNSKKHLKTEKESNSSASNDTFIDAETMSTYKSMGFTEKQAMAFVKANMQ
ncbi:MAG TPA: hypothetical protein VIK72_19230 [Clostridiaceae bacterium]